jgi:hypothetical protein
MPMAAHQPTKRVRPPHGKISQSAEVCETERKTGVRKSHKNRAESEQGKNLQG